MEKAMSLPETVQLPTETLLDHAIPIAMECEEEYNEYTDDNVEWSYWDLEDRENIKEVAVIENDDDVGIRIAGIVDGKRTRKVSRAVTNAPPSKCHPAEYETDTVEVGITIHYYPAKNSGMGASEIEVMQL